MPSFFNSKPEWVRFLCTALHGGCHSDSISADDRRALLCVQAPESAHPARLSAALLGTGGV